MHLIAPTPAAPPRRRRAAAASSGEPAPSADELVAQLLATDPAAKAQLDRVTAAATRVAELQMEQARLAQAMAQAAASSGAGQAAREAAAEEAAARGMAEAELKAAELRFRAAELQAEADNSQRAAWAAQADQEADRLESGKAGAAAAAGGLAASLPFVAATAATPLAGLFSLGGVAASALLFGVVYRYAVRGDPDNAQLKAGVVGAFGLVRGIAAASEIVAAGSAGLTALPGGDVLGSAGAAMGESMLAFGFASVALEFAMRQGMVAPLGRGR
jgi:hypothetical protein